MFLEHLTFDRYNPLKYNGIKQFNFHDLKYETV